MSKDRTKKTTKSRSRPEKSLSPGLRNYLYITAAVCGAAVLIVEILGAKMLSPYFGTSHFVWTAQIAVTSGIAGHWLLVRRLAGGPVNQAEPALCLCFDRSPVFMPDRAPVPSVGRKLS